MKWSVLCLLVYLCLQPGLTWAGMSSMKSGMKSGMSSSWSSSSKGMGMSSMGSYKGYKGYKGMSMKGKKKSAKMEHNFSKYDKLNMMSYKGHSGKGMGSYNMNGFMMTGSYPHDDFFDVDEYIGGKGKGWSQGMMTAKGSSKGSSKGSGKGTGKGKGTTGSKGSCTGCSDDDSSDDQTGDDQTGDDQTGDDYPTESPTRQGNYAEPTVAPNGPTIQPTRTGGSNTPVPSISTASPTRTPGGSPSEQTVQPTQPVIASCETSAGIYGSIQGNQLTVSYGYELETSPLTVAELRDEAIPPLEISFNNFLLPDLFPGVCAQASSRRRRLSVQGISTVPPDAPLYGIPCRTPKTDTANDCVFVRGRLLLFTDETGPREEYIDSVRNSLELGMGNGVFDDAHPDIVKVTYVETDPNGFPLDNTPTASPGERGEPVDSEDPRSITADDGDDDRDLLLPLLLVAGAVLIVLTGIITYRNT